MSPVITLRSRCRAWTPRIGAVLLLAGLAAMTVPARVSAATPSVSITPSGPWHSGQQVSISVGPNSLFTPHARIVVIACADPGGTAAHLPTDDSTCDGNTIQEGSVIVQANGSFSLSGYTLYTLPNAALGEQANFQPVCNATNQCVLFVGQDQNDFTAPKILSTPFAVQPATASTTPASTTASTEPTGGTTAASSSDAGNATTPGASTSSGASSASPAATSSSSSSTQTAGSASGQSGSLAFTGPPSLLPFLLIAGGSMLLIGSLGRRLVGRSSA